MYGEGHFFLGFDFLVMLVTRPLVFSWYFLAIFNFYCESLTGVDYRLVEFFLYVIAFGDFYVGISKDEGS